MNKLLDEFKKFAIKGQVMDLAVGVVIGGAFGKIVSSLVNDLMMPILGLLIAGIDFSDLKLIIREAAGGRSEVAIRYGAFLQTVLDFLIIAWAIFIAVKAINRLKHEAPPEQAAPPAPKEEVKLLTEIRDLLSRR